MLSQHVSLTNGIPSSDTFRRVLTLINPDNIEYILRTHASDLVGKGKITDQIAVGGKALCGSGKLDLQCLYSVSAWCHENGLVLGERQIDSKSNEITVIPLLLESLELKGSTVTIDAAGCQKSITKLIIGKKGNYVLGLKRNHPKLYKEVAELIKNNGENNQNLLFGAFERSHGRTIRRRSFGHDVSNLPQISDWSGARTVIAVETISSKNNDPKRNVTGRVAVLFIKS